MKRCLLLLCLLIAGFGLASSSYAQAVGGACSGSITAGPDVNGNNLKCNGSTWQVALSGPTTPAFKASQPYVTSNAGWPANRGNFTMAKVFDTTGSYNASTGVFTAPTAGYYVLSFSMTGAQSSTAALSDVQITINNAGSESIAPTQTQSYATTGSWNDWGYSVVVYMNASDTAALFKPCCSTDGTVSSWRGMFSGFFLHP